MSAHRGLPVGLVWPAWVFGLGATLAPPHPRE